MKKLAALAAVCLFLSACVTADYKYRRSYSETRLGENVFRVFSSASNPTDRAQSNDFNMLRCAEITLENGFKYFVVATAENYSNVTSYQMPSRTESQVVEYRDGADVKTALVTHTIPGETYFGTHFGDINTIECYKEKPEGKGLVFDAAYVAESVRAKYKMK